MAICASRQKVAGKFCRFVSKGLVNFRFFKADNVGQVNSPQIGVRQNGAAQVGRVCVWSSLHNVLSPCDDR